MGLQQFLLLIFIHGKRVADREKVLVHDLIQLDVDRRDIRNYFHSRLVLDDIANTSTHHVHLDLYAEVLDHVEDVVDLSVLLFSE